MTNSEEIKSPTTTNKIEKDNKNGSDVNLPLDVAENHDLKLQKCFSSCESQIALPNENIIFHALARDLELDVPFPPYFASISSFLIKNSNYTLIKLRCKCTFGPYILHNFHFGLYILFLPLLVPKLINA